MTQERIIQSRPISASLESFIWEGLPIMHRLWNDNHSDRANKRREEFRNAQNNHSLILVKRCSDSRYLLSCQGIATVPTISAGGPRDPYVELYNNDSIEKIVVLPHLKCGGLGAKKSQEQNGVPEDPTGIHAYVKDHIHHQDPIAQATMSAKEISLLTEKLVLAAVHNHENGAIYPLAIYHEGEPILNPKIIEAEFGEFLDRNNEYAEQLKPAYPNLETMQAMQNPEMLLISDSIIPAEVSYPEITKKPGSLFQIRVPSKDIGEEEKMIYIDPQNSRIALRQAQYPIEHFDKLKTIVIETKDIGASRSLAIQLKQRRWMQEWINKKGNRILIAENVDGVLKDIEELELKAA